MIGFIISYGKIHQMLVRKPEASSISKITAFNKEEVILFFEKKEAKTKFGIGHIVYFGYMQNAVM